MQVDGQAVAFGIELVTALPDEGAEIAEACAVGIGLSRPDGPSCMFLLLELALVVDVGALSPYIYIMVSQTVVDFCIEREGAPRRGCAVDGDVPTLRLAAMRDDVDDTHVAVRLVLGRRRGQQLDVLDAGSANHL